MSLKNIYIRICSVYAAVFLLGKPLFADEIVYFVDESNCLSKAIITLKDDSATFRIDEKNLICSMRPFSMVSYQGEKLVLSTNDNKSYIYDSKNYKLEKEMVGVGVYFITNGKHLYYSLGSINPGLFVEDGGKTFKVLNKEFYDPRGVINIGNSKYLIGEGDDVWLFDGETNNINKLRFSCDVVGYRDNDGNLICFDKPGDSIRVKNLYQRDIKVCQINKYVTPLAYLSTIDAVLAVRGRMGVSLRFGIYEKYEVTLIKLRDDGNCKAYGSNMYTRIQSGQIAVVK